MVLPDGGELPSYQDINIRHAATRITEFLPGNTLFERERGRGRPWEDRGRNERGKVVMREFDYWMRSGLKQTDKNRMVTRQKASPTHPVSLPYPLCVAGQSTFTHAAGLQKVLTSDCFSHLQVLEHQDSDCCIFRLMWIKMTNFKWVVR